MNDYTYIEQSTDLDLCIKALAGHKEIALDIEGSSLYTYQDQVCLIQMATIDQVFIIDPIAIHDLTLLLEAIQSKCLICHGADYDIRMLYRQYGYVHEGVIFDTKLAADLLGIESASLAALIKQYYDVTIEKGDQKSDWRKRPLTKKQLAYAANDVKYLVDLHAKLKSELNAIGRLDWHEEWCERILANSFIFNEKEDEWRIKGAGVLKRKELNYLKYLWYWRDAQAKEQNKPPFKIVSNVFLINFAKIAAQHKSKILENQFVIPKNINRKYHDQIRAVLECAAKVQTKQWPEMIVRDKNFVKIDKAYFAHIKSIIAKKAKELKIRPSLILTNADLTRILTQFNGDNFMSCLESSDLMKWQKCLLKDLWKS